MRKGIICSILITMILVQPVYAAQIEETDITSETQISIASDNSVAYKVFDTSNYKFNENEGFVDVPEVEETNSCTLASVQSLPAEYKTPYLSSVKDQGAEGLCSVYSTLSLLESAAMKQGLQEFNFDEHQLADLINPSGKDNKYSGGFSISEFSQALSNQKSPVNDETCEQPIIVTSIRSYYSKQTDQLKQIIVDNGGFIASIDMSDTNNKPYINIEKHILSYPHIYGNELRSGSGHAVHVVGWDDNFSKDHFDSSCPGDGAWIFKNSWSEDFGYNGYGYISYYDKSFTDRTGYVMTYEVAPREKNQIINSISAMDSKDNKTGEYYTSTSDKYEKVEKIGIWFMNSGNYNIKIIQQRDPKKNIYKQNDILFTKEINIGIHGFHTFDIESELPTLTNGENLGIVVENKAGTSVGLGDGMAIGSSLKMVVFSAEQETDDIKHLVIIKGQKTTIPLPEGSKIFSDNTKILKNSKSSKINPKGKGVAYFYVASNKNSEHLEEYKLTVQEPEITVKKLYMTSDQSGDINQYIKNTCIKPVFKSSKSSVLKIDENGEYKALKKGKASVYLIYGADNTKDKTGTKKKYKISFIVN